MRATVRDVAKLAGVSPKTVSNVVNGTVRVSPPTRAKVEQALAELDYVPNLSARGLRNGRTGVIGLALPTLETPYSAEITKHVVAAAGRRGFGVQVEETARDAAHEAELLSRARAQLIDGLILNPVLLETSAVQSGVALPPVVLIGEVEQPIADHVWIDNVGACREMTELLISQGRRRIAVLGASESASYRLRIKGYRQALRAAGIQRHKELEIECRWTPRGGAEATAHYLDHHEAPDAIMCLTDSIALGALNALWSAGLSVPDDVAVTGYDDVADAEFMHPSLTTVHFDKELFAETAIQLLTERIDNPDRPITSQTIPYSIVARASTGPSLSR